MDLFVTVLAAMWRFSLCDPALRVLLLPGLVRGTGREVILYTTFIGCSGTIKIAPRFASRAVAAGSRFQYPLAFSAMPVHLVFAA